MKRVTTGVVVCSLLLTAVSTALAQQAASTNYRTAQYLKVPADKEAAYLEFLRTNTHKIYDIAMQSGDVVSWAVLKLVYEGSPALDYNYVATTLYSGPPIDLSTQQQDQIVRRATGLSLEEYLQMLSGLRVSIGSVLGSVEAVVPGTTMKEGNFVALTRWKIQPGQERAYSDFVKSMILPLHVQDLKDGYNLGWTAGRTMYPGGDQAPFDATCALIHKDLASAVKIMSPEQKEARFSKLYPGESYDAFTMRDQAVRRLVRTELLKVMIAEEASQQTTSLPKETQPSTLAGEP